ncbi:MAG: Two-component sensor CbrB: intrcellular carbon:nitrogen balance [Myxococcaceae bacterium]|nr:Two-component sensor CbrB: intrcellular carbon:nitrogen balance [Myxococcaceae bacterium]
MEQTTQPGPLDRTHDLDVEPAPDPIDGLGLLGRSPAMIRVRDGLRRYGPTSATVLIAGETGTGKELVARALHALSPRARRGPLVAANMAATSPGLLSTELFGHERGAFTGAHARHRGLFEQADRGTLFLDEVGELMPDTQAALLRVLEARTVRPVGGEREKAVDVRLVVATHRDLGALVRLRRFREDLFFRLNTLVVRLPPLRHRIRDVIDLGPHFLKRLGPEVGQRALDPTAVQALMDYGWPGNCRQLANVLHRAAIQAASPVLTGRHIKEALEDEPSARRETLDGAHATMVAGMLEADHGSISATARRLGVARSTLRSFIRRFNVVHERP